MSSSNTAGKLGARAKHAIATTADVLDDCIGKADRRSATFLRQGE